MTDTDTSDANADGSAANGNDADSKAGNASLLDAASRHQANGAGGEGDAAAGGDGAEGAAKNGADDDAGKPGQAAEGDDLTVTVTRAELADIPKNFFDKDGNLTVPALAKAWKASNDEVHKLRDKKAPEAPEKPEDYDYALTPDQQTMAEKVLQPGEDGSEDPLIAEFRQLAHDKGVPKELFGDIVRWYITTTAPLIPDPIDQKAEIGKLGQHAQKVIDATDAFGESMKANGLFSDSEYAEFRTTATSAAGISMLNKIRAHYGETTIPTQLHREAAQTNDAADLDAKVADIATRRRKGDITDEAATREMAAVQEEYDQMYGTEAGGTSIVRQ